MNRLYRIIPAMMITAALVSACGGKPSAAGHDHAQHQLANGDVQETTKSADQLPSFLNTLSDDRIVAVYKEAAKHTELLQWIPCFCGCGTEAGHKSNMNCFVKEIKEDGTVVWDDHGTRCGVCLNIAASAIRMQQQGMSVKDIRAAIDQAHSNGTFAPPTKTPLPA